GVRPRASARLPRAAAHRGRSRGLRSLGVAVRGRTGRDLDRRLRLPDPARPRRGAPLDRQPGRVLRGGAALPPGVLDVPPDGDDMPEQLGEYRRIAVFGGVYNNWLALEATLTDARRRD